MQNPSTVTLSLTVKDGHAALDFYQRAFGAENFFQMKDPGGGIAHAEFDIGNTHLFLSEESPEWHAYAMPEGTLSSCIFTIMAEDCDAAHDRAVEAGGASLKAPEDQFWGSRVAIVSDPFGYRWAFHQQLEELSQEELLKRAEALFGSGPS